MSNMKRTLSALLAIVMVFSTLTVAFTVVSAAVPNAARTESANPEARLTVPQYLQSYGTNSFERGNNIAGGGKISLQVSGATDVSLSCSEPGMLFSQTNTGTSTNWTVGDGSTITTGATYVQWTARYKVGTKYYTTNAWSAVKQVYNDPGFATHFVDSEWYETHESKNDHIEWITPVYGNYSGSSSFNCYLDKDSGTKVDASAPIAAAYYQSGSGFSRTLAVTAVGNYYLDLSDTSVTDLSATPLRVGGRIAAWCDTDDTHIHRYRGTALKAPASGVTLTDNPINEIRQDTAAVNTVTSEFFSGSLSGYTAGSSLTLGFEVYWEGNVRGSYYTHENRTTAPYSISVIMYNKGTLKTVLENFTRWNYQESQYCATAPSGINTANFKSWSDYQTALRNAWVIYGKEDVSQTQINNAVTELNACKPTYSNGTWVSGMYPADADYAAIDLLVANLPARFKNFTYADGTYGKYYKHSVESAVTEALADIAYDRPLPSTYQGTVDTMKATLAAAIANLDGGYKDVNIVYTTSETDVRNMPNTATVTLFSSVQKPTDPSKTYYRFDGWYYDAALTNKVTWPIAVNPTNTNFAADLTTKVDNAGTAYTLYAKFTLTGKTLEFVTNGGSSIASVTGNSGDPYSGPASDPTRDGYTFCGWYSDISLQNAVDWSTFTFGLYDRVYAKWERASFTVTFNANGGIFASTGTASCNVTDLFGNAVARPESPTRANYGFDGWYYDAALSQAVDFNNFTIPSENITVYAKWNNAVRNFTFVYGNGSDPMTLTVAIGSQVNAPSNPTRAGYVFAGWYANDTYTSTISFPYTMGSNNVSAYAKWTPQKFNVYFTVNGGTMAASFNANDYLNLDCGSVLTPPATPTKEGFVFDGWMSGGSLYTFTTVPAYDLYLEASWSVEPPTAHFRLRTDKTGTVSQGDIINATVSIRTNYITGTTSFIVYYDNRYLQPALNDQPYLNAVTNSSACSKTPGAAYFTVVQNSGVTNVTDTASASSLMGRVNASTTGGLQNYYPEEWLDMTIVGTTKTYSLKSEYANMDYVWFIATESTSGTHATPTVEQDIASFQFMVKDTAPTANGTSAYAQLLMPTGFYKTGASGARALCCVRKTMIEYNKNDISDYNVVYDLQNNDVRYAVQPMQTSTITFESNGGTVIPSITGKVGRTIQLDTPEKANYRFLGWTTQPNSTNYVNASAYVIPANNITLYAQWKGDAVQYYVYHYKRNLEGTAWLDPEMESFYGDIGETVTASPKTYEGFTITNTASQIVPAEGTLILKLYYARMDVAIVLDAVYGTFPSGAQTVTLRGKYEQPINNAYGDPSRTGYRFKGWLNGGTTFALTTYPAVSQLNLQADWEAETYTLTFILDGSVYTTITQKYGTPITAPSVSVGPSQIFSGWVNTAGQPFSYTTMPAGNETFTGTREADGYTLTLVVDGTQYGTPVLYSRGATITANMVSYTPPTGYAFNGWYTQRSVTSAKVVFPFTLNANTTIYGFTSQKSYSITMLVKVPEAIGGDGSFEEWDYISTTYGDYIGEAIMDPEFDGCGFNGWYIDEDLTNVFSKPNYMPAEDLVIYGELYVLEGTVAFDVNGGTGSVDSITAPIGESITLPGGTGVSRQYYKFGGWGATANATTPITYVDIESTETITVYAIWTRNYANISFELNGGTGTKPTAVKAEIGETVTLPAGTNISRDGFLFIGWSTNRNATTGVTTLSINSTQDLILYAVWAPLSVSLTAKTGSNTVIDEENGFIYGLALNMSEQDLLEDYLTIDGNGTLRVQQANYVGTGLKVELVNNYTGNVDATYYLVLFGDTDGDGMVSQFDIAALKAHMNGADVLPDDDARLLAGDVDGDGIISLMDIATMKGMMNGAVELDQATRRY